MRPIKLSMSAFGPFAGIESIDFTKLGTNPLFLINGPTGAGKSTILDAICFALYGETTGNEREAKQMRCDHADADSLTEVTLEFALAGNHYRIKRIPDQSRPKARGEGTTEQKARAELHQLDGEEETLLVAPKITEATDKIIELTGLSAEQFRQVMVLPQGKFRDLLLAKSEEREAIFQQLFQTHVYSVLQNKLREQANTLTAQIKTIEIQQSALLEAQDLSDKGQLDTELLSLKDQMEDLSREIKISDENAKKSQQEFQKAKLLEQAFVEQIQAQSRHTLLQAKQDEIAQRKIDLERAKMAAGIQPIYQQMQKQSVELIAADKQVEEGKKNFENAEKSLADLEIDKNNLPEKEKKLEKLNAEIIELNSFRQRGEQFQLAQKNLVLEERKFSDSNKVVEEQQKKLAIEKESLKNLEAIQQKNMTSVDALSDKKYQLEKLEEKGIVIRKITELESAFDKTNQEIESYTKNQSVIRNNYQKQTRDQEIYEQSWRNGQAAILAANLQENESCPVCGSLNHPEIAHSQEKLPTEQELNRIQVEVEKTRRNLDKITRDILLKEEERKNIGNLLAEEQRKIEKFDEASSLSLVDARAQYQKLKNEILSLQKIKDTLPKLQLTISDTKNSISKLESELLESQKSATINHGNFVAAEIEVKNKKAELPEIYRDLTVLENKISTAIQAQEDMKKSIVDFNQRYQQARENHVSAATMLKSLQDNLNLAKKNHTDAVNLWRVQLKESDFENDQDFIASSMDKESEAHKIKQIREYEDEKLVVQKQLEEKNLVILDKERPDLVKLAEEENRLLTNKGQIESQFHKAQQRQQLLTSTKDKLKKSFEEQVKLETEYGIVGKLSDVSNGKNPHNLSLQRFVLSVLLDDVLTEASHRLLKMSKGRYQLYRKETVGDKRTKAGLDLEVEDAYTGKQRPAATLSGGESFMAALALALGLSDVVQAYAGGIRLDTLFIDEGFGSLDPESLELAMNTLMELRDSGRMVGIISHVDELKRMIDVRLDVVADREMSTTSLVGI